MLLALFLIQAPLSARDSVITAVRAAAEQEPVEGFSDIPGLVRVRDIVLLDVNGDGAPEAFVWIEPHVRQTPTILAYSYDVQHGARHLLEGLVPGRPQLLSGTLIDDHTMGFGIDMTFDADKGQPALDFMVDNGVQHHMSVVFYRTFIHVDGRAKFLSMADLSSWKLPVDTKTCEAFEFSPVEALAAGTLTGGGQQYLVALTASDITIYQFRGIRSNGMFDKKSWVRPRPTNVAGLTMTSAGVVALRTQDGKTVPLGGP